MMTRLLVEKVCVCNLAKKFHEPFNIPHLEKLGKPHRIPSSSANYQVDGGKINHQPTIVVGDPKGLDQI